MKRLGNLYDKIISMDNLRLADERARKGKTHSYGVRVHDKHAEADLLALHEALKAGTYKTSEYSIFTIYEPKERIIYRLPYFPDRIVHHAIMNILEPVWVSVFTADTYSCIKGRGIQAAADKVRKAIDRDKPGCAYCLKIDIRKFYPSIDHDVLKAIVRRKIKDTRLLKLLDEIIDSAEGLPIGNYLTGLKLHVKDNKQIFPVAKDHKDRHGRGIDFLGFVFYHNETRLRKRIKQNLCRKVAKLRKRKKPLTNEEFKQRIASWWGWAKHSDSEYFINKLNSKIKPYEIKFKR